MSKAPTVRTLGNDEEYLRLCASTASELLSRVPPRYLVGLKEVVVMEMSAAHRTTRLSAQKKRMKKGLLFGAYFPDSISPWIELYVDNLRLRFGERVMRDARGREVAISMCLLHEVGHHIARWIERRRQPTEGDAKRWEQRLSVLVLDSNLLREILVTEPE